jgi:RNA polymerase sigma-70 factor (ECF subfamily)
MIDSKSSQSMTQELLGRVGAGDEAAVNVLLQRSCDRLTQLTRHMLGGYQRVKRWADTDDVLQNALLRLVSALRDVKPQTPRDFLALATLQIRRELIDLSRHFYGAEGIGAHHDSAAVEQAQRPGARDLADERHEPSTLAQWRELHQQIDTLPEEEREIVGLLFYQGLSQAEAAELLNVSVRTVQRRWHVALCKLYRVWNGE